MIEGGTEVSLQINEAAEELDKVGSTISPFALDEDAKTSGYKTVPSAKTEYSIAPELFKQ